MFVEKELFVIPNEGNFVLYAPSMRAAVTVTGGVVRDLQTCEVSGEYPKGTICDTLLEVGILKENAPLPKKITSVEKSYMPTSVTLFTTSDCGLRCIYCYASAGVTAKVMDFLVAKAAIDLIIENAIKLNEKKINVSFHGGGEPLYGASRLLVHKIVAYAKETSKVLGLRVSFSCATNGVLSMNELTWVAKNIDRLSLSVDGPPEIQDIQRPLKTGGKSSPHLERTLAFLEDHKISYGVRATITRLSVNRLTEVVKYIHRVAPSASMHIEPLFSCGRCATTGAEAPDANAFVEAFVIANKYAKSLGKMLYNSGASVDRCDEYFCGASRGNFCVTPWGDVTSCYEVSLPSDERAKIFFFGAYNTSTDAFCFNEKQLATLRERCVSNITACKDCFMKFACSGDCPAKSASMTDSQNGGFRCDENRSLGMNEITERASNSGNIADATPCITDKSKNYKPDRVICVCDNQCSMQTCKCDGTCNFDCLGDATD